MNKKSLISVADKQGIVELAKNLKELGYEIIATGGTQKLLSENGIPAIKISDYTGGTESERVKTLSQRIAREILETGEISIVVCNLYPFFNQENKTLEDMIEYIDIGGVTLIRAAAKNYKKVGVVFSPAQYDDLIKALKENRFDEEYRLNLARKAFDYIAWYDAIIAHYFNPDFKQRYFFSTGAELFIPMRYGENPHQNAGFYLNPLLRKHFEILGGKELSYNNLLDAEIAFGAAMDFEESACAIIKHQTPCGVATGETLNEAYERAYMADSISAFGGIVGLNRKVDVQTAEAMAKIFYEVIIAPDYEPSALEILRAKKNLRLIKASAELIPKVTFKSVFNGILVQDADDKDFTEWKVVTKRAPSNYESEALKFAWKVVKWVKSNAIVIANKGRTVGIGGGQTSRVGAVEIAIKNAGAQANGAVLASDAFFPFRDGIDAAAKGKITAIIQPGGSKRDEEVIQACNEYDIAMVFTGYRHFRH
ncbi:MAG: bifunctional phosphoribosylaminoimidazolecarboxamide formyltransferase/IMP cyclohydrolase [candidate division WOR-3 bacterium]|nr:bifunctional phosphoribosylaminoimidazolecarboxamide formyltransferase/IMP cyclohydrolase [candidate division WOR-3 bacterium]